MPPTCREERGWIPEVERGCCCSLEGCCKVQAIIVVVMSLLYVPSLLIEYLQPNVMKCPTRVDHENGMIYIRAPFDCEWERQGQVAHARTAELIVKILLQSIAFGTAILFLLGITRRRPKLLLPYVRVLGVHMVFNSVSLLVKACVYKLWAEAILFILPIGIGVPYYMWICAYSLYRKMKSAQLEPPPLPSPSSSLPSSTGVPMSTTVRIYAPPPGFVVPSGFGFALPSPAPSYAPAGAPAGVPAPCYGPGKPSADDSPPPPYEEVVGQAAAATTSAATAGCGAAPPKAVVVDPNGPSMV